MKYYLRKNKIRLKWQLYLLKKIIKIENYINKILNNFTNLFYLKHSFSKWLEVPKTIKSKHC